MNTPFDQSPKSDSESRLELFLLRPNPDRIIQIFTRCRGVGFSYGFCREAVFADSCVQFVGGFRRCSDPSLAHQWSEPCDFGLQPRDGFAFELVAREPWMTCTRPEALK